MYRRPSSDEPLLFGDVFSSEWLFDAVIREDAMPLRDIELARGRGRGFAPVTAAGPKTEKDFLLAHGRPCRAILVSDDCEIETCIVRRAGKSRLLFAVVSPWPSDQAAAEHAAQMQTFRRHPLEPADGFEGGIAELFRLFAVSGEALLKTGGRVAGLEDYARARLEQRWAAFATRRGPIAAVDNATKLAHVLDANGDSRRFEELIRGDAVPQEVAHDVAKAVARALTQAWRTEGEIMQQIADVHATRTAGEDEVALLEAEMRKLGELALEAADQLRARPSGDRRDA
jgi:AcrR family transcriptional regulator